MLLLLLLLLLPFTLRLFRRLCSFLCLDGVGVSLPSLLQSQVVLQRGASDDQSFFLPEVNTQSAYLWLSFARRSCLFGCLCSRQFSLIPSYEVQGRNVSRNLSMSHTTALTSHPRPALATSPEMVVEGQVCV
jgi:hypothetical protein